MDGISDKLRRRLEKLTETFCKQIPERFSEIEDTVNKAKMNPEIGNLNELRLLAHKLAGSAATFNFNQIGEKAKELELYISTIFNGKMTLSATEWSSIEKILNDLRNECTVDDLVEELESVEHSEKTDFELTGLDNDRYIIYLFDEAIGFNEELFNQLEIFGYTVNSINNPDLLEETLNSKKNCLIIANINILEGDKGFSKILKNEKNRKNDDLNIIFISDNDDFNIRLDAVRSGGDAFFIYPLDFGKLSEKIDSFSMDREGTPYHVLIIDDDKDQVAYSAMILQEAGMITSVASDPMKVLKILAESKPELILMDMYMPKCNGKELASIIRQQEAFVSIPIIFLSLETDKDKQIDAIRTGGDDFLTKPIEAKHLIFSVESRAARTRSLRYFMERDSLTGLLNHTNLKEQLMLEVMKAKRTGSGLCFAMIDLDHFKKVNDTYGHLTGDSVLKSLSRLLRDRLRRTDIIGRYGGEEFGVILLNTDPENAFAILDDMREKFSLIKQRSSKEDFHVKFSCGIAGFPFYKTSEELGASADKALYRAKEAGRNCIFLADNIVPEEG